MPTDCLFREDSYLQDCDAKVVAIEPNGGIVLDRTVFYAASGGQPADRGSLITQAPAPAIPRSPMSCSPIPARPTIAHVPAPGAPSVAVGDTVKAAIDWPIRHARMRMHTALRTALAVLPYAVTGGSVGEAESRLDFDIPDAGLDKDAITAKLAEMIATNAGVTSRWIADAELEANPGLIKTMSVKPPMGTGRVRLIEIAGLDLQPCGGTHVRSTAEIGAVQVTPGREEGKIEPARAAGVGVILHPHSETPQMADPRPPASPNLVTTDWLAARPGRARNQRCRRLVLLAGAEARRQGPSLAAGHIPGAVFFDIDAIADRSSNWPHMLPGTKELLDKDVGALGIGKDDTIVIYDGAGLGGAPRVWWTFKIFGAKKVYILDGGLPKWKAEGRPLEQGTAQHTPRKFEGELNTARGRRRRPTCRWR